MEAADCHPGTHVNQEGGERGRGGVSQFSSINMVPCPTQVEAELLAERGANGATNSEWLERTRALRAELETVQVGEGWAQVVRGQRAGLLLRPTNLAAVLVAALGRRLPVQTEPADASYSGQQQQGASGLRSWGVGVLKMLMVLCPHMVCVCVFQEIATKLDKMYRLSEDECQRLRAQFKCQEDDREYLIRQVSGPARVLREGWGEVPGARGAYVVQLLFEVRHSCLAEHLLSKTTMLLSNCSLQLI
jgi:hypothetical protein